MRARLRPSQARMDRLSRSRVQSTRIPTIVPCVIPQLADLQEPADLGSMRTSASVPQFPSPLAAATASPSPPCPRSCPFPVVSTLSRPSPSESRCLSLTARARRVPSSSRYPSMDIISSTSEYTFDISLPIVIKPEMVTITTAKGDKVKIVADAWHLEADCKSTSYLFTGMRLNLD